jgi:hypothetical protein
MKDANCYNCRFTCYNCRFTKTLFNEHDLLWHQVCQNGNVGTVYDDYKDSPEAQ